MLAGVLMALATTTSAAAAQSNQEHMAEAVLETASEMQECTVYFVVSSSCFIEQSPTMVKQYRDAADRMGELALESAKTLGMSTEAFIARHSLMGEKMMEDMGKSCINVAVLQRRYAKVCQRLSQSADTRLLEWIACKKAKKLSCPGGPSR